MVVTTPLLFEPYPSQPTRRRTYQTTIIEKDYSLIDPSYANPPLPVSYDFASFGWGTIRKDTYVKVEWDEKKTVLNQAILKWVATKYSGVSGDRQIEARLYVNDVIVSSAGWPGGDYSTKGNMQGTNIGAHLKNGANKFSIEVQATTAAGSGGLNQFQAWFTAQFTGQEPYITPGAVTGWQKFMEFLQKNALWLGLGTVTIVGVATIPKIISARKRKQEEQQG